MLETRKSPSITGLWLGAALFGGIALVFFWLLQWTSGYVAEASFQDIDRQNLLWSNFIWIAGFATFGWLAIRNVIRIVNLTHKPWWLYERLHTTWNDNTPYEDDLPA